MATVEHFSVVAFCFVRLWCQNENFLVTIFNIVVISVMSELKFSGVYDKGLSQIFHKIISKICKLCTMIKNCQYSFSDFLKRRNGKRHNAL